MTSPGPLPFPAALQAPGTQRRDVRGRRWTLADLPPGAMRRVSRGDLDVLLVHSEAGIVATEDRCPHMSAPLSEGRLEGCVVHCPLHRGAFDLRDGEVVTFPTTGGLDADGQPHGRPGSPRARRPSRRRPTPRRARGR